MPIDAKKNQRTPYSTVLKCAQCGLGALSPLPEPDAIPALYVLDSYYTHGESHMRDLPPTLGDRVLTKLAWTFDRQHLFDPARIAALLPPGGSICDLGCGDAQYLRRFKALGFSVTGVDPDPAARAQAAEAGVTVEVGTAESIPEAVAGRAFDLIIMTHSLEHCRDPRAALDNAHALTRPGGLCYVEVPNCDCEHFRTFATCSEMFDSPRHIYFFDAPALEGLMKRVGFAPVDRFYQGYVRDFGPGWREWESMIADRVAAVDPGLKPRRHDFGESVALFFRSFWRKPEDKYDSIGFLMKRPEA
jgi:SAM-dependent methyltransferase